MLSCVQPTFSDDAMKTVLTRIGRRRVLVEMLRRLLDELDKITNKLAASRDFDELQCRTHGGKHQDEIIHEYNELPVAFRYFFEVLNVDFSQLRIEIIEEPYPDDLLNN